MKQIKIQKEFWDLMVSGKKKYEFRKLSKGLTSGTYEFVSVETIEKQYEVCSKCEVVPYIDKNKICSCECGALDNVLYEKTKLHQQGLLNYNWVSDREVFGTATISAKGIYHSHKINIDMLKNKMDLFVNKTTLDVVYGIDKQSFKWVCENYIDKKIEFIAYVISNVKESK